MARALRIEFEDALYHVCARGNARGEIFRSDADRSRFLQLLEHSAERFAGAVLCFVLMDNHFHLVARTHCPNLSRWMHWLMVSYSVYFNRRYCRSGHLFQGRYKSFLVESGEYLLTLSRYIHLNPVRGSCVGCGTVVERRKRLRASKWSSYLGYAGLTNSFAFIEEMTVLDELAGSTGAARLSYRRFVEEGLISEIDNPFKAVQWQTALGSERLLQQIRDRIKGLHNQRREMISVRKVIELVRPEAVLSKVAAKFKVAEERLKNRGEHGLQARNVAMWIISESCGITLREIGELFGGLHYSAVAQRIRRARASYPEKSGQALIAEISNI
jgi:putative transposase